MESKCLSPQESVPTAVSVRPRTVLTADEIDDLNRRFESAQPTEVVAWAVDVFGSRLALTASFADTLLIDMAVGVEPDIEVIFLDTGFHFAETLQTVRWAMERYELHLTVLRPEALADDVWAQGIQACCAARKTEPLDRYLCSNVDGWLSGMRRDDDPGRAATPIVMVDRRGLVKVNPLATMTDAQVDAYAKDHDVITNPLASQGYSSIGCWPCTEPSEVGRGGRWAGSGKTECGLHL